MMSARVTALLRFLLVAALLVGCRHGRRHSHRSSPKPSSGVGGAPRVANETQPKTTTAVFSAPIAATRLGHADVVAGLVVATGTLRVMGLGAGAVEWTVEALRDVAWAPDAELRLQPAADGIALFWRGLRDGKPAHTLVWIGPHGELRAAPIEIGTTVCSTADGVAWVMPHTAEPARVRSRRWSELEARDVFTVAANRDPELICGEHDIVVLGEGDDDITASTFALGDLTPKPPNVVLRDADFPDEQREHNAYSVGDDFGLVRIGTSGSIAIRDLPHDGPARPWRRLKHVVSADDDVVLVDGDANATLIVFTHGVDKDCAAAGATPESVRAIRVGRAGGEDSLIELAPADCDRSPGPFWMAAAPTASVVAWVDRLTTLPSKAPPIDGVVFRVLGTDGVQNGRTEQPADAFVAGGCDERGCSLAALVREAGSDGSRPAPIRVFGYP